MMPAPEVDPGRLRPEALPVAVVELAAELRRAGGQAWLVGGAVRDLLLGRTARDWDLATDLLPEKVVALFPRSLEIGIRFGTVAVVRDKAPYQITTFRWDGTYSDSRRPDEVRFSQHLEEDLIRRDFTINALAYDPASGRLADPTSGLEDLRAGRIRAVGDPLLRFREDALRLLRAARFAAELGFEIEESTYRALVLCAPGVERISQERIREEMDKLLLAPGAASALSLLHETGILRRVLPELAQTYGVSQNRFHAYDVFHHTLAALAAAPAEQPLVRLAALFHDLGKPVTREIRGERVTFFNHQAAGAGLADAAMRRLRYSTENRQAVGHLVRHHMFHYRPEWTDAAVRRFLAAVGAEYLPDLFALRAADTMGNGLRRHLAPELVELRTRIEREISRLNAVSLRDLAIGGRELMEHLSLEPGPEVGRLLRSLLAEVIEDPEKNRADLLLRRAEELHRAG
jgi:tRNA nucleotidyltransferase (CCA-adding enzyme)